MKIGADNQAALAESLQRFQQARETAAQRMQGNGSTQKLIDLIKTRQQPSRIDQGTNNKMNRDIQALSGFSKFASPAPLRGAGEPRSVSPNEAVPGQAELPRLVNQTLQKANELLLYNADSQSAPKESGSRALGNYVDLVA